MSQGELAHRAHTSLATIQSIEAGRANPSLTTLERVIHVLGLRLELKNTPPDWTRLASVGVPLLMSGEFSVRPDKELLKQELLNLSVDTLHSLTDPREASALRSWLRALHDHYPQVWARYAPHLSSWLKKQRLSGPEIKLRRIALSNLAGYL
jgi:DNA-binding XRE family transcriptional regulator